MITHLGDAILDVLKIRAAHGQMVKPLKRVSIQIGLSAKILDGPRGRSVRSRFSARWRVNVTWLMLIAGDVRCTFPILADFPKNSRSHKSISFDLYSYIYTGMQGNTDEERIARIYLTYSYIYRINFVLKLKAHSTSFCRRRSKENWHYVATGIFCIDWILEDSKQCFINRCLFWIDIVFILLKMFH